MTNLTRAALPLRLLYVLALSSAILPYLSAMSGWVGLTLGGGMGGAGWLKISILATLSLIVYRLVLVLRKPSTLDAPVSGKAVLGLRLLAILLMALGTLASLSLLAIGPLTRAMFGRPGDAGIGYYVVTLAMTVLGGMGLTGLLLFEFSRLRGFETSVQNTA